MTLLPEIGAVIRVSIMVSSSSNNLVFDGFDSHPASQYVQAQAYFTFWGRMEASLSHSEFLFLQFV
jgi:hypothetical protein